MKEYILIAGVNGAGKSTLYQSLPYFEGMSRINTDEIVAGFGRWDNPSDVAKAAKIAINQIEQYFKKGISFNQETTLCGHSIKNNILRAKELGYKITVHYIGIDSVELAKSRILHRVSQGGHGIPDADVERRFPESQKNLIEIVPLCDKIIIYDNTEHFKRIALLENGELKVLSEDVPLWWKNLCTFLSTK